MAAANFKDAALTLRGWRLARGLMRATPFYPREQMAALQLRWLRALLDTAYRYVPYYQKLFWNLDFDPYRVESLEELQRLPVLTKDTLRSRLADLCSMKELRNAIHLHTSGTTGTPLNTYTSAGQWVVEQAAIWRQWGWAGYRFRDRMAVVRSHAPPAGAPPERLDRLKNWLYISPYHLSEENCRRYLRLLAQWRPRFLRGYPSSLYILARAARQEGIQLPSLRGAFTASETLLDHYRREIETGFGVPVPVFDHYGQAETSSMLHECERHEGLHILADYGHVDLLPSGHAGLHRLIATNLHNTAMPLIRYDTGDLIELAPRGCSCGRQFPLVARVSGRADQLLMHHDGFPIPSVNIHTYFAKQERILRFQVIQHERGAVEVRILPRAGSNQQRLLEAVREEMSLRFGGEVQVLLTEQFEQCGEGKCVPILQRARSAI
jgi:phenylacetate-CoA ligase